MKEKVRAYLMSVKIKQVVPVTGDFLLDQAPRDYIGKYLNADTVVDVDVIPEGQYSIESEYDEAINAPQVVRLCKKAAEEGYDGIYVDCFGDPGVRAARECVSIPVFGGFEPAMLMALGLGDKVGIVTVLQNVIPMIEGNIAKAHLGGRTTKVRAVNMPVADLENTEKLIENLVPECIKSIEDGAAVIVLGCTGMIDVSENVQARLLAEGFDVPVVEAAGAALNTVEMYAKMKLRHSGLTYMAPPEK